MGAAAVSEIGYRVEECAMLELWEPTVLLLSRDVSRSIMDVKML